MSNAKISPVFQPENNNDQKPKCIVKSIVYGNTARSFGKKRDEDGHTHEWKVYVRPYENEDMGLYVRKVQFKLHESYTMPLRTVTNPPYEITESGWGEFEVVIKIFFQDVQEKPLTFQHLLKLFPSENILVIGKRAIVYETYNEIMFHDPTPQMLPFLTANRKMSLLAHKHHTNFKQLEEDQLKLLDDGLELVGKEFQFYKEKLLKKREELKAFKKAVEEHEKSQSSMLYDMENME